MYINKIPIHSHFGTYSLRYVDFSMITQLDLCSNDVILVDAKVKILYSDVLADIFARAVHIIVIDALETNKTAEFAFGIIEKILENEVTKATRIIAIGGGIIQDLSGFIASTIYRGLEWILVPTTLLSQTDSCIGAKTSINFKGHKNILGSFYNPALILVNPAFIQTLSNRDYLSGLGELVKLHLIGGEKYRKLLIQNMTSLKQRDKKILSERVNDSLEIKKGYIEADEFDKGVRNTLNYGHCIGHAIETTSNYSIPHGQAVTIGMAIANRLSVAKGMLSDSDGRLLEEKILSVIVEEEYWFFALDPIEVVEVMKKDKKRTGSDLVVIYPDASGGFVKDTNVKANEILRQLDAWNKRQRGQQ